MGEQVDQQSFSREDRTRYRKKVRQCLDVFERMLVESRFDADDPATGLEIELNLVDDEERPAMCNTEVLATLDDPDFQTELGKFNIEINVAPKRLSDKGLGAFAERDPAEPERRRGGGQQAGRQPGDDRHPADPDGARPRP